MHDLAQLFGCRDFGGIDDRSLELAQCRGACAGVGLGDHRGVLTGDLTRRERVGDHRELAELAGQRQRRVGLALGQPALHPQRRRSNREPFLDPILGPGVLLDRGEPRELQLIADLGQAHDIGHGLRCLQLRNRGFDFRQRVGQRTNSRVENRTHREGEETRPGNHRNVCSYFIPEAARVQAENPYFLGLIST